MIQIKYSLLLLALLLNTACSQQPKSAESIAAVANTPAQALASTTGIATTFMLKQLSASQQQQFDQAKQLMQQQNFAKARDELQNIVANQASFAGVWYNLAVCQWQLKQISQAEHSLQQALIADAKSSASQNLSASLNLLGILAREQGQFANAEQYWLQAVQVNDTAAAHKNLGILYELYLGQLGKAKQHYQRYFELSQNPQAKLWLTLIERQLAAQGTSDAEESL